MEGCSTQGELPCYAMIHVNAFCASLVQGWRHACASSFKSLDPWGRSTRPTSAPSESEQASGQVGAAAQSWHGSGKMQ
eukprot:1919391-Pyramimonas_sp.AAC.1